MACTIPVTRSAGYVFLDYFHTTQGNPHRLRVRLSQTADPLNNALMLATAQGLALQLQPCINGNFQITGWGTMTIDGAMLLSGTFAPAYVGTHTTPGGSVDHASKTVTFYGRGTPATAATCKGPELFRLFIGSTFTPSPEQKWVTSGVDADWDALVQYLLASTVIWFDYYGQKAGAQARYPIQYNAAAQRRLGS